jgi:ssDNA-binding Zn-finger/Zn-ribbon topoisomerase 1
MTRRLTREEIEALFSGKNDEPVVENITMDDPRVTEHQAPCVRRDLICADCGAILVLRKSRFDKPFYGCSKFPECNGSLAAHTDGRPMGRPGNRKTKDARIRAHRTFDRLWQLNRMTRPQAYEWMQKVMKLPKEEAHIGYFTVEQCEQLIAEVTKKYPGVKNVWERLRDNLFKKTR